MTERFPAGSFFFVAVGQGLSFPIPARRTEHAVLASGGRESHPSALAPGRRGRRKYLGHLGTTTDDDGVIRFLLTGAAFDTYC